MTKLAKLIRIALIVQAMAGGLLGFAVSIVALLGPDTRGILASLLVMALALAFALVFAAGLTFWLKPDELRPMLLASAVQVPWVSLPGIVYRFVACWYWSLSVVMSHADDKYSAGFKTKLDFGSFSEVSILRDAPIEVGVNVIALAALLYLYRLNRAQHKATALLSHESSHAHPEALET